MSSTLRVIAGGTCGTSVSPLQDRISRLTTSFGIVIDQTGIIIDHGYGVQNVVAELRRQSVKDVIILQTHFHMDHVAGMSMNSFFFDQEIESLAVCTPNFGGEGFFKAFREAFNTERWPVSPPCPLINQFSGTLNRDQTLLPLASGIRAFKLNHPGGSVAYRIPHPSGDVVIATDHEPNDATDAGYARFVSGAELLIADIQYRQAEYDGELGIGPGSKGLSRRDWGHATPERLLETLRKCEQAPKTLWVTHHDPMRPQSDLDVMNLETRAVFSGVCMTRFVEDGDTVDLV